MKILLLRKTKLGPDKILSHGAILWDVELDKYTKCGDIT